MLRERSRKFKEQVLALDLFPNRDVNQISPNEPPEAQLKHSYWTRRQRSWISPRRRKRPGTPERVTQSPCKVGSMGS